MITTTKETDLEIISDEELFELQQGFIKLHDHAKKSLEEVHVEIQRRLENNFKK
jgi:hypothetical protein|tara:strand:- start:288 stop:449 length:162 start_codon:yes stop_codon:yes gene_type:complete